MRSGDDARIVAQSAWRPSETCRPPLLLFLLIIVVIIITTTTTTTTTIIVVVIIIIAFVVVIVIVIVIVIIIVFGPAHTHAHAYTARAETGFVSVELAQRALEDSAEGKPEGDSSSGGGGEQQQQQLTLTCPICGEGFADGRPLRMHLMSPRHTLRDRPLSDAILAAQQQRGAGRLVYFPLEGVTGRTKAMAAEARRRQKEQARQEDEAWDRRWRSQRRQQSPPPPPQQQQQEKQHAGEGAPSTADGGGSVGGGGSGASGDNDGRGVLSTTNRGEGDEWMLAARCGDVARLRELYAAGGIDPCAAVDALGSCALHWAAGNGHLAACK